VSRALVTGATGLVGSHIVDQLLASGWSVRALVRSPSEALRSRGVECVVSDVLDDAGFRNAASGADVIFHTAAAITPRGGWEAFRRLNVDGTTHAIAAAESSGARLLQLSSVAVYGSEGRYQGERGATSEDAPLAPLPERAYYARSKRESEQLVMAAHAAGRIWATAVRPCVIYGPRDRQFTPRIGRLLSHGVAPLVGGGGATLAVVHAANVADGAIRAAMHDAAGGRSYNLANEDPVSVRRFLELAAMGMGRKVRMLSIPEPIARALFGVARFGMRTLSGGRLNAVSDASLSFLTRDNPFTSERAKRELGWRPLVRPEDGVPASFRWWAAHAGDEKKSAT